MFVGVLQTYAQSAHPKTGAGQKEDRARAGKRAKAKTVLLEEWLARAWRVSDVASCILAVLLVAFCTKQVLPGLGSRLEEWARWMSSVGLFAVFTALLARFTGLQNVRRETCPQQELKTVLFTLGLSSFAAHGALVQFVIPVWGRHVLATAALASTLMFAVRTAWRCSVRRRVQRGVVSRNFVLVGLSPVCVKVRAYLDSLSYSGYTFKGTLPFADGTDDVDTPASDVIGSLDELALLVRRTFVDEIILTKRPSTEVLKKTLACARDAGVDVRLIPGPTEATQDRTDVEFLGALPTIVLYQRPTPFSSLLLKRVVDVVGACAALAATLPLCLLVALAITLDSKGPLLYSSERLGHKGRAFKCYKFRTMSCDAERRKAELAHLNERKGVLFKMKADPRITRVGRLLRKYSLDEIPQFWNVLRGDMSLVGPRPPLRCEVEQYQCEHLRRLNVVPGITGLWQVEARGEASFDRYVELDRRYVMEWTLWLDLKILLRTVSVVLGGTGS